MPRKKPQPLDNEKSSDPAKISEDLIPLARPVDQFAQLPGNPRRGDVAAVARSLASFGQRKPIVALRDGVVLAGNHTLQAALTLGWQTIAAVLVDDDDTTAKAFALADNRTGELGGYDEQALADLILEVRAADAELLEATGWQDEAIADLLDRLAADQPTELRTDPDHLPDSAPAKTLPGDVWILGRHRLICGDSTSPTDIAKLMDGADADLVWTDPPYNVAVDGAAGKILNDDLSADAFGDLLTGAMQSAFAALRPGGSIYVAHSESERLAFTEAFVAAGFKLSSVVVWRKNAMTLSRSDYQWQHEPIIYGWKPGRAHRWYGGRKQTTVVEAVGSPFVEQLDGSWHVMLGDRVLVLTGTDVKVRELESSVVEYSKPSRSELHPTMKPVALVERQIMNSSRAGDVVLDLFGGSGSTLIAAHTTSREARLVELDPRFCDVICKRFQMATGIVPIAEATGREHDFCEDTDATQGHRSNRRKAPAA